MKHVIPLVMTGFALIIGGVYLASIEGTSEQTVLPVRSQPTERVNVDFKGASITFEETSPSFNETILFEKTDAFIDGLIQPIDDTYRLETINSIDELYAIYENVATRAVVKPYLDFYFTEEKTGVYVLPTELPPWFEKDQPYRLKEINRHKVSVTQENSHLELYGVYQIELVFEWVEGQGWMIVAIDHS